MTMKPGPSRPREFTPREKKIVTIAVCVAITLVCVPLLLFGTCVLMSRH